VDKLFCRFVAERGDSGQMTYIDNIDIKYNLKTTDSKSQSNSGNFLKQSKSASFMPQISPLKTPTFVFALTIVIDCVIPEQCLRTSSTYNRAYVSYCRLLS